MEKFDVVGRPAYGQKALVLVPKLDNQAIWAKLIKPGSSMVGFRAQGFDATIIYYEGNIYGASNLKSYEDRAICAYGRLSHSYPTVAMCADQIDSLEVIGHITQHGMDIEETAAYRAWVALDETLTQQVAA